MTKLVGEDEARRRLTGLSGWSLEGSAILWTNEFPEFMDAIRFVDGVAEEAEKANHHPDITINWRTVKLSLTTHDSGGLTVRDFRLAGTIKRIFEQAGWGSQAS